MGNPIYANKLEVGKIFRMDMATGSKAYDYYCYSLGYELVSFSGNDVYAIPVMYSKKNNFTSQKYIGLIVFTTSDDTISDFTFKRHTGANSVDDSIVYPDSFSSTTNILSTSSSVSINDVTFRYDLFGIDCLTYPLENCSLEYYTIPTNASSFEENLKNYLYEVYSNDYKIGETDNWFCNGIEVAPFPDTHLFKVLVEVSGNIVLMASDKPADYVLSGDTLVFNGSANGEMYLYDVKNVEWVLQGSATVSTYPVGGTITWSNYILNRKATADSTEVEEIPRDTMIGGTTYDGADYFETPDTGGTGGDNEGGNTGGDTGGGEVTVTFDTQAFLNGLICGLLGKGV